MGSICTKDQAPEPPARKVDRHTKKYIHSSEDIMQVYSFGKLLGTGSFGSVRVGHPKNNPSLSYAIKTISVSRMKNHVNMLNNEIAILRTLDHPNLIKFHEVYQDQHNIHFVQELCSGGEILDRISQTGGICEKEAGVYMMQLLQAVNYLHERKIVHRDLKLDNLMLSDPSEQRALKIIDFGMSRLYVKEDEQLVDSLQNSPSMAAFPAQKNNALVRMRTLVGTPVYMAPEVYSHNYDYRCDYWSIGVIMFSMLSGRFPFQAPNPLYAREMISQGAFDFHHVNWRNVSDEAKDLIRQFLQVNPRKRISFQKAVKHKWFRNINKMNQQLYNLGIAQVDRDLLDNLALYNAQLTLSNEVRKVAVYNFIDQNHVKEIQETFQLIDKDNQGYISEKDLKEVMQVFGYSDIKTQIEKVFDRFGSGGSTSKGIYYSDFLQAAIDTSFFTDQKNVDALFDHFDTDNTGYITSANLSQIFARQGSKLSQEQIDAMLDDYDILKDKRISLEEFRKMMRYEYEQDAVQKDKHLQGIMRLKTGSKEQDN